MRGNDDDICQKVNLDAIVPVVVTVVEGVKHNHDESWRIIKTFITNQDLESHFINISDYYSQQLLQKLACIQDKEKYMHPFLIH